MSDTAAHSDAQTALVLDQTAQNILFRDARTANSFSAEPVTDEQIEAIYDLMKWAPTSANTQPLRITVVRSPDAKARLLPHMADSNRKKVELAPAVAILSVDLDFHENIPTQFPHYPQMKDNFTELSAREPFGKFNAALQAGYFIIAVRAAGLAAGPMAGFDAAGVDAEFFGGTAHRSILVVNMGKPGDNPWFGRLPRLDFAEVVTLL